MTSSIDELQESRLPPKRQRRLTTPGIPWYRDIKVLQLITQALFALIFIGGLIFLFSNLTRNLNTSNLSLDFGVFQRQFNAEVSDGIRFDEEWQWVGTFEFSNTIIWPAWIGIWVAATFVIVMRQWRKNERRAYLLVAVMIAFLAYTPRIVDGIVDWTAPYLAASTMTRALITGFYNTLRVVILSIIACTILGIFLGIGLLSRNYLVRTICQVYTEIFRNTPLLIQLIFIHQGLQRILPEVNASWTSPNKLGILGLDLTTFYEKFYVINVRGLSVPAVRSTETATWFYLFVVAGFVTAFFVYRWRIVLQDETGTPAYTLRFVIPTILAFVVAGWIITGGYPQSGGPWNVEYPRAGRFNIEGGWFTSLPFFSLFIGLTLYTAAFIADIVRAGIQAVPFGQIEAARSQGFKGSQVLSLVVLPQALRLIVPPLGNQYVNLGKNSSLGIAVSYADTYNVVQLANNESGQAVPFFVSLMVIYLSLSLSLSLLTNLLNRFTQIRTR